MPRRRKPQFIWIPPNRTTKWSVTIGSTDISDEILAATFPHGLITEELVCEIELDNSGEDFTDVFSARDIIEFKMDFADGSTTQFKGEVEEIKSSIENGFFKYKIKGAHFSAQFLDVIVTKEYVGSTISDIRKDLISNFATDFSTTNVEDNTTIIDIKFVAKALLDCLIELDIQGDEDTYVDFDKDVHSFKRESKNNDNEAVVWDDSLINLAGLGTDSAEVRNKVTIIGDAGGLPVLFTSEDLASQTTFRSKEKVITDTSIRDEGPAETVGDAEVALLKDPKNQGSANTFFQPRLFPGGMNYVISPPHNLHARFRMVKFTFVVPTETMQVFFNKERSIPKLFKDRIRKEQAQERIVNPNNMTHSYNFTFDNENKIDSASSTNFIISDSKVRKGAEELGIVISDKKDTPVTVGSVHILAIGEELDGATYLIQADSQVEFQPVILDTLTPVADPGTELRLQIKITSANTRIDAIALLYKV